ncbi:hypothetical protein HYQ45_016821 [Verticillium longisporum]|uniref:Uncharacterized protein n=1 Tax=Verticillium longisporum TaxID=100787 RepID=A0A0G4MHV0_VERLO|nr:hypothetical protein HYQ44_011613 [Verticillium longisporum]KAG7113436.1 hypothetical protein HYQ45_016821 [Verticillium longisporum]KAG7145701.1 hypothetical protein HYQ46_005549 [Verticillium longisporum]CRK23529.1 hypothetical protein BN1723_013016 [Verticillium longisporum]CRK33816.1 hypothetical protein BN1708_006179 [Verticillium longisporum]
MKLSTTLLCAICPTGVLALEDGKLIDGVFTAYDDILQLGSITSVDKRRFLFPNLNSLIPKEDLLPRVGRKVKFRSRSLSGLIPIAIDVDIL